MILKLSNLFAELLMQGALIKYNWYYSGFNQSSLIGIESKGENKISNCHKLCETGALGSDKDSLSLNDNEWAGADLNRRHTDFQSVALPTELPARNALATDYVVAQS